jgi:hypothetical protein
MKRYTPFVPAYSGRATFEEDEKGEWVKWNDVADNNEALKQAEKVKRTILLARETGRWHLTEVALEQLDKLLQAMREGK